MQKEELLWPAQHSSIFRDDHSRLDRDVHFERLEDHFGRVLMIYGPVRASKSAYALSITSRLQYFKPAGIGMWCFIPKALEDVMDTAVSRTGLQFDGEVQFIRRAEEMLQYAGDRIKRDVILVPEVMLLDSGIIPVSHELKKRGKCVILEGLDLDFRGRYFPFADYESGQTMEDLISSVPLEDRYPRISYCTSEINAVGDRCREQARFTQRRFPNDKPCPWHDTLVRLRNYTERAENIPSTIPLRTFAKDDDLTPIAYKYRAACAEHLVVPHSTLPRLIEGLVAPEPHITYHDVISLAGMRQLDQDAVEATLKRMLAERLLIQDGENLSLPRRYAA